MAIVVDPIKLAKQFWPDTYFYREQKEIIRSVWDNDETVVPAGNMLGKDFVSGRIVVLYFLTHYPCRIITTSAKDDHLRVMWGEIGEAIQSSVIPLAYNMGGPLICNHHELRRVRKGKTSAICYVRGMVAKLDSIASMQGHHAKYTLFVCDESSSVPNAYFKMANGWAKKKLILGNPWQCSNYFFTSVEGDPASNDPGGDIEDPDNKGRYYRKILKIKAEDSPNVRLGLAQKKSGKRPTDEMLVPGVKTYSEYMKNRLLWDPIQQCVSLDAEFYKGGEVYLFPKEVLDRSKNIADLLEGMKQRRIARSMGVDAAEGGDDTVWTVVDEKGIIDQLSRKTADTSDVPGQTIALMRQYNLDPGNVLFDRGGGGKEHADRLRRQGYNVRTVGFNEKALDPFRDHKTATIKAPVRQRVDTTETGYAYKNRRAEMYGLAALLCKDGYGIPVKYSETIRQLKVLPKLYDEGGRLYLPPKDKPNPNYTGTTIKQMLGRSPDQADSFVLAVFGMLRKPVVVVAGALV